MHVSKGLLQSYQTQDFCHAALMSLKESLSQSGKLVITREDAGAIKNLVSAWESAQMRVAFHRRVPAVKAIAVERKKRKTLSARPIYGGPTEPLAA